MRRRSFLGGLMASLVGLGLARRLKPVAPPPPPADPVTHRFCLRPAYTVGPWRWEGVGSPVAVSYGLSPRDGPLP
jgi:hypothetical protein